MNSLDNANTIIITISFAKCCEKKYLLQCGYTKDDIKHNSWLSGSRDEVSFKKEISANISFILINPHYSGDGELEEICKQINALNKRKIIWAHNSDDTAARRIMAYFDKPIEVTAWFAHKEPLHNSAIEVFLNGICDSTRSYNDLFNHLIEESLKKKSKEYLVALFILCQGYLAAHGIIESLNGWSNAWNVLPDNLKDKSNPYLLTPDKILTTINATWWESVFKSCSEFENTELFKELDARSIKKEPFEELFKASNENTEINDRVISVYDSLKKVLA